MERRAIHEDPDGYYFRSPTGQLYGPLSRFQFEAWSMRGAVGPGSKVWRQQGAHHYRVEISRRLKWQKLLSVRSCGAMSDWLMTFISVVSLVFAIFCSLHDPSVSDARGPRAADRRPSRETVLRAAFSVQAGKIRLEQRVPK